MKIKFITGFSCFGGSTLALLEHCKILDSAGYDVEFYGDCDWHLNLYKKSKLKKDLIIEPEDILVCHLLEMPERPKCKLALLYLHEQELFNLNSRNISGYDKILFVCESQKEYHNKEGIVIPNPVTNFVDPRLHSPPNKNIVGVVGTIQPRKQQHVSIQRALEDGFEQILLFGNKDEDYFRDFISPLLSENVKYMGLHDPEKRMEMYNQFDILYNFSLDESASLVLGECKILGKPVIKNNCICDFDIVSNETILAKWNLVFSNVQTLDKLVCVVTHDRMDFIDKWLRAWNNSHKFGAKVAVLHAIDGNEPDENQKNNILKHNPDFYIPFKNDRDLKDLKAIMSVAEGKFSLPQWEYLFWFTDDMLPMRRNFLKPFVSKIKKGGVGLVAQCYEPKSIAGRDAHIRTVAYSITKDVANRLKFPDVGLPIERPYFFEHGKSGVYEDHILNQVKKMGYNFELCHSEPNVDNYQHWTSYLDWMWDCHLLGHWSYLQKIYEEQFDEIERLSDVKTTRETLISIDELESKSLIPGKICAIIPTFSAPVENLVWSIFSLLINSDSNVMDHMIVSINGPDPRTGSVEVQDKKQSFIEELRSLKWGNKDMPITLMRTWSRIGHAQTIEQCMPWVHTEFYLSMHDDIIVLEKNWHDKVKEFQNDEKLLLAYWDRPVIRGLTHDSFGRLELPHFSSIFTLCKKSRMKAINASWIGYYVPLEFKIGNFWNYEDFIDWYKKNNLVQLHDIPSKDANFKYLTMDIGGAFISDIFNKKLNISKFSNNTIFHFGSMSWRSEGQQELVGLSWGNYSNGLSKGPFKEIIALEREIKKRPDWWDLYQKYVSPKINKKSL
jgi:hypothetical protein